MDRMTRRRFLGGAAGLGLGAFTMPSWGQQPGAVHARKRPNVLLIISDQLHASALSCAGDRYVSTPNIDRLAAQGTWFRNAQCGYPLCVPSRISMFTGVYPHERKYFGNNGGGRAEETRADFAGRNADTPILTKRLADAGYDCGYVLKWHIPVDEKDPAKSGLAYYGSGGPDARTRDLLQRMQKNDGTKPFFYTFSYDIPHQICGWARDEAEANHENNPTGDKCPPLPSNFARPDPMPEDLAAEREGNKHGYPTANYTDEDWRQYRWAYRRFTEGLDAYVGQILTALEHSPHRDNTIVVFVADHGDGDAAHHWNQKTALWEETIRVPWIIRVPGAPKGIVETRPVSSGIDMVPSVLALLGMPVPDNLAGQSLKPVVMGQRCQLRPCSVTETAIGRQQGRCIRTERYKYTVYGGENGEMFFDLQEDPGESKNLIADPAMAEEIARHRKLLAEWVEIHNDTYFKVPDPNTKAQRQP